MRKAIGSFRDQYSVFFLFVGWEVEHVWLADMGVERHGRWNWLLGLLLVYRNDSTVSSIEAFFFLFLVFFFLSQL